MPQIEGTTKERNKGGNNVTYANPIGPVSQSPQAKTTTPIATPVVNTPTKNNTTVQDMKGGNAPSQMRITNDQIQETKISDSSVKGIGSVQPGQEQDIPVTNDTMRYATAETAPTTPATTATESPNKSGYQAEQDSLQASIDTVMNAPNASADKLNNMAPFEYNAMNDPSYLRDASAIENQIANIMVGRGGLYSSVANNAIQAGLMNLQVQKSAEKRQQYVEDRNFLMNMAQNELSEKNAKFNQLMALKQENTEQYKLALDIEQQAWARQMEEQKYKDAKEAQAFEQEQSRLRTIASQVSAKVELETAQAKVQLSNEYQGYKAEKQDYDRIMAQWAKNNGADLEVFLFFKKLGIAVPIGTSKANSTGYEAYAQNYFLAKENKLKSDAMALNQFESMNTLINGVQPKAPESTTVNYTYDEMGNRTSSTSTKNQSW